MGRLTEYFHLLNVETFPDNRQRVHYYHYINPEEHKESRAKYRRELKKSLKTPKPQKPLF